MPVIPLESVNKLMCSISGIFGYINYLVEKDRKFILDTLVNGQPPSLSGSLLRSR
jgi:glucosamine--fructose-6-phosphate aminotransferase (isomerizing)